MYFIISLYSKLFMVFYLLRFLAIVFRLSDCYVCVLGVITYD